MNIEDFPKFELFSFTKEHGNLKALGKVDSKKWIGERHIAYLFPELSIPIEGRFANYDENTGKVEFVFKVETQHTQLKSGSLYSYTDGYWGERILVAFGGFDWQKEQYVDENNHDHCFFCWATICSVENSQFWRSNEGDVVCEQCHKKYVGEGMLDFIHDNV